MDGMRWREEMEQAMDLIYRIQVDHGGSLPGSEAREIDSWVDDAIERAERLSWLVSKGDPPVLKVTYGGRKALDAALASRAADVPQPHWFGGSIITFRPEHGPLIPPHSLEPYEELMEQAAAQGLLTQEDIDRIAHAPRKEPEEPGEFRMLDELSFPGTRWFAAAPTGYEEGHPFGGGSLDPAGHEGAYQVAVILTRRGAPDSPHLYVADANALEGDSHLWLPEYEREDDAEVVLLLMYGNPEGGTTQFQLLANRQGRLGQIRTVLRANDAGDARRKAHRILNPFLCDLSYRYDVPMEVLQMNVAELATFTLSGMKQDDFREKLFDPEQFFGPGVNYGELPNYELFTGLYREGANSSSVDYGFLCFFRIAEGVIHLRRKRVIEQEGKDPNDVSRSDVFLEGEIVEGEGVDDFPPELKGESLWKVYKELERQRNKVGHAFLYHEDPVAGHQDIIADRLEGEEQAGTRRAQARYLARRMLQSEFWPPDEQE